MHDSSAQRLPSGEGAAGEAVSAAYGTPSSADRKQASQIFSESAASGILVNDLIKIMEEEASLGFTATPVDDNIYKWTVKMRGFDPKSLIAEDLRTLSAKFGCVDCCIACTCSLMLYFCRSLDLCLIMMV